MKKAKWIIGMVLLIVGGYLTIANLSVLLAVLTVRDVDYRLGSAVMVLIFVLFSILFSAGLFMLGWRLWREQAEAMKRARMEALAPRKDTGPEEAEHIARWESALAGDCAIKGYDLERAVDAEGLDELFNNTGADWYSLGMGSDLAKVVRLYAEVDTYRKACEVHRVKPKRAEDIILCWLMWFAHDIHFLIVTQQDFLSLGAEREQCLALCREHELHLVLPQSGGVFLDLDSGRRWNVFIAETYPGSVDDAATYGSLALNWTDPGQYTPDDIVDYILSRNIRPAEQGPGQYTPGYLLSRNIRPAEQGPGARMLLFKESLHQWRLTVQLDQERLWFLSVFVGEDGGLKKFSLDYEGAADSHYEFTAEKAIRDKLYFPGDEKLYFHDILVRYVKEYGGNALLNQIMPHVTAQYHYD